MDRVQRRDFLIAAGVLLAAPFSAEAQQAAKIARIGSRSQASGILKRPSCRLAAP